MYILRAEKTLQTSTLFNFFNAQNSDCVSIQVSLEVKLQTVVIKALRMLCITEVRGVEKKVQVTRL